MSTLKNILTISLIALAFILSLACYADVSVSGYYRKDGTYVRPHMRSNPDSSFSNNWSTVGNVNPYTGKRGTKTAPTYNYNSIRSSSNTNYTNQLAYQNDVSKVNDTSFSQPYDSHAIRNKQNQFRDYETVQLESMLKIKLNGINWYHLTESKTDITYVRKGVIGYFHNYPTVSLMYKGSTQLNGRPAWLGTRFIKVIVDCNKDKIALVANAVVDSNNEIVSDIDYPKNARINWMSMNDYFDPDLFKSTSRACNF